LGLPAFFLAAGFLTGPNQVRQGESYSLVAGLFSSANSITSSIELT